ncbi:MAG: FHA domain-containing protein, partial [Myxococcota bacterium]
QLIGVQGADTGRRHSISGDEALIGRSSRCTIVLAEPSVSRQHARIERRPDGFYVVDLESGNGTFVNGQRVAEERIFSGDEVTFGNGTFQFIETGDRFEPVDASAAPVRAEAPRPLATAAPFSRPLAFVVASAVMLLVVGGVIITLQVSDSRRTEALNQAFSRWRAGVNFFKTRDWDRAEALFNQALEVVPDHKRSLRYLDAIHREREAEKLVSEADTALSQKELETAYVLAVRATESIAYGARAREVLREVDAIVDRRVERARNALRGGRTGAVKKELAGLEFIEPYRREIFRLKNTKSAEGAAPERPPKKGGGAVDDNRSGSANDSRNEESAARSAFIQGDLRQAREIATDGGLRELADRLARFSTHLANGTEAVQARRGRTAVRPL